MNAPCPRLLPIQICLGRPASLFDLLNADFTHKEVKAAKAALKRLKRIKAA